VPPKNHGDQRTAELAEIPYPISPEGADRTSGFERALEDMGVALLERCVELLDIRLADEPAWEGAKLPTGMTVGDSVGWDPSGQPTRAEIRRNKMLEAAPAPRRALAELAHTRMTEICRTRGEPGAFQSQCREDRAVSRLSSRWGKLM